MLIAEHDTQILQAWLERKLATISDAEAPILAEYCIALLNHDQPVEEVKRVCVEQLGDFLKEHTTTFVDEVFHAIDTRSFIDSGSRNAAAQQNHAASLAVQNNNLPSPAQLSSAAPTFVPGGNSDNAMMVDAPRYEQDQRDHGRDGFSRPRKPCFAYQRTGSCARGSACRYEHAPAQPGGNTVVTNDRRSPRQRDFGTQSDNVQRARGPQYDKSRSTLIVENIPAEQLDPAAIQQYFTQFGGIENVDLNQREKRAIVKFADWDAANRAYTSPAPIFDNRFVKVFWRQEDKPIGSSANPAPLVPQVDLDPEAIAQRQQAHDERMAKKQEMETKMAALRAQQLSLLNKQAENESRLAQLSGSAPTPGSTTAALEAQLNELKAKAASLGIPRPSTYGARGARGRGAFVGARGAGRGRGAFRASPYAGRPMTLDNRTRKVVVDEFDPDSSAQLKQHIMQLEYESIEEDGGKPVVTFKSRPAAERFIAQRRIDGVGQVSMSWVTPTRAATAPPDTMVDVDMNNQRLDD